GWRAAAGRATHAAELRFLVFRFEVRNPTTGSKFKMQNSKCKMTNQKSKSSKKLNIFNDF
ncbi:MAG: hypothetical protein KJ629_07490, partial [Candidatus Omnitrophica bacterium]|nr:hypothetical protein [Candidatus Omnitrophota bacterium]